MERNGSLGMPTAVRHESRPLCAGSPAQGSQAVIGSALQCIAEYNVDRHHANARAIAKQTVHARDMAQIACRQQGFENTQSA